MSCIQGLLGLLLKGAYRNSRPLRYRRAKCPSSYETPEGFAVAAKWVHDFIAAGLPALPARHILNINIPDSRELRGAKITYQPLPVKPITSHVDPRGRQVYLIGLSGEAVAEPQKGLTVILNLIFLRLQMVTSALQSKRMQQIMKF